MIYFGNDTNLLFCCVEYNNRFSFLKDKIIIVKYTINLTVDFED